jgi:hypothetical protein
MKKPKSANDWLKELMAHTVCSGKVDDVPEGWMTVQQMANAAGICIPTMKSRVDKWLKNGLVQKKAYKINIGRQISSIFHYYKS